ncbi:MAG: phage minor capsid protein [Bacteroides sp.]|nr:phage minor capsid protein [Eubacterium sp.]MCM1419578.1 phage minor capsid protein [Roseburia sp.]MCM1463599.1 phage minor capsid protein [Bacteroides sp.]
MDALNALNYAAPIAEIYHEVEERLLCHIAEQLSANPDTLINATSEWRIKMLAQMGRLNRDTARIIAARVKKIPDEVERVVRSSIDGVLSEYGLAEGAGIEESIATALKNYDRQAVRDKYNQVNTVMQYKARQAYVNGVNGAADRVERRKQKPLENAGEYLNILNENAMAVTLGERSRTEALRETIAEMNRKGIPAFVDKTGREWSPEAYVNMDIRNTAKNAALAAEFASLDELGQDVILVTSHSGARPLCAPYQGKLYSRSGKSGTITDARGKVYPYSPLSETSFGEAAGLFGINCGHRMRGVSDGTFINREKEYDDAETSEEYKAVQKQREIERKIRKDRTEAKMLEAVGDPEGAKAARSRAAANDRALREYCEREGLSYRRDRTEVYGYRAGVDKSGKSGIIKEKSFSASQTTNFRQLSDYLKTTYEIEMDEAVKTLNFEAVKDGLSGVEKVISEYPDVGKFLNKIVVSKSGVMSCSGNTISFNPLYFSNEKKLAEICAQQSSTGGWIKNSSIRSLGAHEAGHEVEWAMIQNNPSYDYDFQRIHAWKKCDEAKPIVSQACKNIKKTPFGKGKTNAQLI